MNSFKPARSKQSTEIQGRPQKLTRRAAMQKLPPEVAHLKGRPLYYIIAQWGLRLGRTFSPSEVQAAFHLTPQQASNMLRYIYTQADDQVVCEQYTVLNKFGREAVRAWRIVSVTSGPAAPVATRRRPARSQDAALLSALRAQLAIDEE